MLTTYERLYVNVHASNTTVVRAAAKKLNPQARRDPARRVERHRFYRIMLAYHKEMCELAREFRL